MSDQPFTQRDLVASNREWYLKSQDRSKMYPLATAKLLLPSRFIKQS